MANIRQTDSGKWQAQVAIQGVRKAKSFRTKREAEDWANRQEFLIRQGEGRGAKSPLSGAFDRYAREVSPTKKGARWEMIRLEKLAKDKLAEIAIGDLTAQHFADWRDRRLREVSPSSVRREMVLMSGVLTVARREWGLIDKNPMQDVRKPANAPARDRRVYENEIEELIVAAGRTGTPSWRAVHAFRFAIETAMRAGEICGLHRRHITGPVAHLPETKNGRARDVPLSSAARTLLGDLPETDGPLFGMTSRQLDGLFRKVRSKTTIEGLRFHDSRAEALTRLSKKVEILTLARISGHTNIAQLMTYYRETAEQIAEQLD
ncbi:MAG: site-specific integrase [Pseudomonadota bacterium]